MLKNCETVGLKLLHQSFLPKLTPTQTSLSMRPISGVTNTPPTTIPTPKRIDTTTTVKDLSKQRFIVIKILKNSKTSKNEEPNQTTTTTMTTTTTKTHPQRACISVPFLTGLPTKTLITKTAELDHPLNDPKVTETIFPVTVNTLTETYDDQTTVVQSANLNVNVHNSIQTSGHTTMASTTQLNDVVDDSGSQDMSGAMPMPVCEDIDVPEFIDEYLERIGLEAEITNKNDNNNMIIDSTNIEDIFGDNFEFDMNMIAGLNNNNNSDSSNININSSSSRNNRNIYASNYNSMIPSEDLDLNLESELDSLAHLRQHKKSNGNNFLLSLTSSFCGEEEDSSLDAMDFGDFYNNEAVIITPLLNDSIDLVDCLCGSQQLLPSTQSQPAEFQLNDDNNDTILISQNNSQTILTNAEPFVPAVPTYCEEICQNNKNIKTESQTDFWRSLDNFLSVEVSGKRSLSSPSPSEVSQKRQRLEIDISSSCSTNIQSADVITTPDVVDFINSIGSDEEETTNEKFDPFTQSILDGIIAAPTAPETPVTPALQEDIIEFDASSYSSETPQSCNSSYTSLAAYTNESSHTSGLITTPNSPQPQQELVSFKHRRGRGRPPKNHSDLPNEDYLRTLNPYERKSILSRAKNNEASRLSRLKHRQRQLEQIEVEQKLKTRNIELRQELMQLQKLSGKLKHRLKENHFKLSLRA